MLQIPSGFFQLYRDGVDELLRNPSIGEDVTLVFVNNKECPNCKNNEYNGTGTIPFSTVCIYCGGSGSIEEQTTEVIRLRVYDNRKNWLKVGNVEFTAGRSQVLGKLEDADKIRRCSHMLVFNQYKYKLATDLFPHGFGQTYFVGYIDKC